MNSVHGPAGAEANADDEINPTVYRKESKGMYGRAGSMTSFGICTVESRSQVNPAWEAFSPLPSDALCDIVRTRTEATCEAGCLCLESSDVGHRLQGGPASICDQVPDRSQREQMEAMQGIYLFP